MHHFAMVATGDDIRLRRLTPADADHMNALLQRLSPQSRYRRYFRFMSSIPPADVARFVAVSPNHMAVGAFDNGVLVGAAQYFRSTARPDHAEATVEVADSHQRRRVGTRLAVELARLAAHEGITHFNTAEMYGGGKAEEFLAAARGSRRDEVVIATKFLPRPGDEAYAEVVVTLPRDQCLPDSISPGHGCPVPASLSTA